MGKTKAFTLMELLIVVSIIALLMAILIPVLQRARAMAHRTVCLSLLRSFGLANMAYASANDGKYVPFSQGSKDPGHTGPGGYYWDERWPENMEFRNCIAVHKKIEDSGWEDPFIFPKALTCPSHKIKFDESWLQAVKDQLGWKLRVSYAMNTERWVSESSVADQDAWYPSDRKYRGHYDFKVKRPGDCMMFIDSNLYQTRYERANYTIYWDKYGDRINFLSENWAQVSYRHNEGASLVFFDGHAGYLKKEDIYNMDNSVKPFAPLRRDPEMLWDVEFPLVGCKGGECADDL